jgi:hypothetical protein
VDEEGGLCVAAKQIVFRTGDRTIGTFSLSQVDLFTYLPRVSGTINKDPIIYDFCFQYDLFRREESEKLPS